MLRKINVNLITEEIERLCIEANYNLSCDVKDAILKAYDEEVTKAGKMALSDILENLNASERSRVPICQDTGMAVVFLEIGQDVHLVGGDLEDAVNEGVRRGYKNGYLRFSVVRDPILRGNTNDNTPAVIHTFLVPGDKLKITVAPKGFGSENMSRIQMMTPSSGKEEIVKFVADAVLKAASNPCPPIVVGVGIGGTFEKCAMLAKKALLRPVGSHHKDPFYEELEKELLEAVNETGVGPQGFGGKTTALGVNIETYPTHIAGLPVAVNINCHVTRHKECVL